MSPAMSQVNAAEPWSLDGKNAVVTGGSRGIGRAIAIYLARKGLSGVAITYASNATGAEETLKECRALGVKKAIMIQADMQVAGIGPKVINDASTGLNATIDILVNNAVLTDASKYNPVLDLKTDAFTDMMIANVYSPVSLTSAFIQQAPKYGGRVINISSMSSRLPNADPMVTYGATKAALESFTRSFASFFAAEKGMTFNSVSVGPTVTDAMKVAMAALPPGYLEKEFENISADPRPADPEEIARIVGFLASEEARWVNGASVSANGGHRSMLAALG